MTEELKSFKQAMLCHHPNATPAEESIAWALWRSAWSEGRRDQRARDHRELEQVERDVVKNR